MPLDVLGCTRATMTVPTSVNLGREVRAIFVNGSRAGDRPLQLLVLNEEFLVDVRH